MDLVQRKSINTLLDEAELIELKSAKEAGALGFMARAMTIATMPHKKTPGCEFKRSNGAFTLTMLAPSEVGLPYGSIPRLLVAWMTTEVQKTREPTLVLGTSLGGFMRDLGIVPSAGRWGTKTRLRDQMRCLFSCSVHGTWRDESRVLGRNYLVVDDYELWWDPKAEGQSALWQSTVTIGKRFFQEILDRPIPIDLRALRALRRSPLALDIYTWLTYRMSYASKVVDIPWDTLQLQFGSDYAMDAQGQRNFRYEFRQQLKKVLIVYREAKVDESSDCLRLYPSPTHVRFSSR